MLNKTVVLGISGGIAAYKAAYLASLLTHRGAQVHTVMTQSATEFITPLTLQSLTHESVHVDLFAEQDPARIAHIALADSADIMVIAPATANLLARAAHGFADDLLTTTILAATCPVVFVPAMNVHMYENPLVQANMQLLRQAGYHFADPGSGPLACGYNGLGRMMEPEDILEFIQMVLTPKLLVGRSLLVTAGPTRERIDPVRFISNDSTGTMGYSIAQMAWRMGADVTLVSGPVTLPVPMGVNVVQVETAVEMLDAVTERADHFDVVIKTAAVGDFRMEQISPQKIKKGDQDRLSLNLIRNPDILQRLSEVRRTSQFIVGFAAETQNLDAEARRKLHDKGLDMLVANNVLEPGAGFGYGTNKVTLYYANGETVAVPVATKIEVAETILRQIADRIVPRVSSI